MSDYVMVPREPTEAMLDAARYFWGPWLDEAKTERAGRLSHDPKDIERARQVWEQMIAAAPDGDMITPPERDALLDRVREVLDELLFEDSDRSPSDCIATRLKARALLAGLNTRPVSTPPEPVGGTREQIAQILYDNVDVWANGSITGASKAADLILAALAKTEGT